MNNTLSHSFTFQTHSLIASNGEYENILHLSDENSTKHFVQYIQYDENTDNSIDLRHMSIKVDRSYFLEIANVCIDNRERRRHFFSTLGKRRFGASNKHLDSYLTHTCCDEKSLFEKYLNNYENIEFEPFYKETTKYSTNKFRVYIAQEKDFYIIFLDQLNITSRKKIHKIFTTDITEDELKFYNEIATPQKQVNYIFNKIGKKYFKNLEPTQLNKSKHYKTSEELALSMLITGTNEMERSSRIQDNSTFRKLQEVRDDVGRVDETLYASAKRFINNPTVENEAAFSLDLKIFKAHLKDISGLKDILSHLKEAYELMATNTISYLLSKNDHDIEDIFLYILESFGAWNNHLYEKEANIKSFNSATIDLSDALRHFVDICYRFKHEYKCNDAEDEIEQEVATAIEAEIALEPAAQNETVATEIVELETQAEGTSFTSAQSYFSEIDIDPEVYDELLELERDIDMLTYATSYTEDINESLILFFQGYTRVLNPLFEFKDLSYSLMLLSQKLADYEIDESAEMLLILMRGLISDLLEWKRSVLIEQTAEDIHFMDKSFYSNIAQIEMSLEHNELETAEDEEWDMEFF